MLSFLYLSLFFIFSNCLVVCSGMLSNVTIDDAQDVDYYPPDQWTTQESTCTDVACPPAPDTSIAFNGSWHENVFNSSNSTESRPWAEVQFLGSAVYVYCILAPTNSTSPYDTLMTFFIDGEQVGTYSQSAGRNNFLLPQTLVYSNNKLSMGPHTLVIANGDFDNKSYLMILDDIIYTTNNLSSPVVQPPTSSSSSLQSKNKVLTGVLVAICFLFGILLAFVLYRARTAKARRLNAHPKTDIEVPPTPMKKTAQPPILGWVARYLHFNSSKGSIAFNPSLLVAGRPRLQSESSKGLPDQRQSPVVLVDELDAQSKRSASEGRWAFITSWRDRAMREAEIPSLPPTSYAPTTVTSVPNLVQPNRPQIRPLRIQEQQPEQEIPGAQRTPRRAFTVMNT